MRKMEMQKLLDLKVKELLFFLKRQGIVLNAEIRILKNCKYYVAFYLNNCLCAIDSVWASKIVVEV